VEDYKINFKSICAGKFRRYFTWQNFIDPFIVSWGFLQSIFVLMRAKPNCVMVAGSFAGVPVAWASWLLRIPILIHQQDIVAGLANKLMANVAKKITVSFEVSLKDFFSDKTVLTGNPVREEIYFCDPEKSKDFFKLKKDLPLLLILGGGTGAQFINELVEKSLAELLQFCQIIHITGSGKSLDVEAENYHQFEFLTNEMPEALCAADLVVSRAGISTLSELIILGKPVILIPIPQSHQEINAQYFQKNNAVLALRQENLNQAIFTDTIKELFFDKASMANLSRNILKMMDRRGAERVARELLEIAR
ncbi:UDP-N-acetylglucosamine--N-acetylmuramyl-(pentapeptide) pyrophosphoryl-undecaprenol N-acetylglucosamine transferase, partial [Candidatus Falkowbacteria bacterium]|nr:UDP-N-acetylglucosamine--N-acetylmuramyl-(pentapeptide) pyrophosphoryl-undecaprenol N-acetylglucosamine transferase [Candidatus Falkowbacteria bacterium]